MLTAGEFCNRWVVCVEENEPASVVAERMSEHHVGALVVVSERGGERYPIGVITDRDLVVHGLGNGRSHLPELPSHQLVQRKLVSARESESLTDVVARMRAFGIRRLPVVDDAGALQGLITFDDVVGFVAEQLDALAELLVREQQHERAQDVGRVHADRPS